MPKNYYASMKEALSTFDLKKLKRWMKKSQPLLYKQFERSGEIVQMATMCKMICNRTDMFDTDAHKKAVQWLKEHNMKGEIC